MQSKRRQLVISGFLIAAVAACGSKKKDDDSDDKDTGAPVTPGGSPPETGSLALSISAVTDAAAALSLTGAQTSSFSPVSYKIPIKEIYASETASTATGSQSGSGQSLYKCSGATEADCQIDLLDAAALKAKLGASVAVPVGTYKSLGYSFACGTVDAATNPDGMGIHVAVKGTVEIAGTTYYTTSGAEVLTTDATKYGDATLAFGGCGGKVYNLDTDLVVEGGKDYKLNLFLSTDSLAWGSLDGGAANPGGCVHAGPASAPTSGICSNLPAIVPVVGDYKAKAESYEIASTACGAGLATFVVDATTSEAIGVFLSRYYDGTSNGSSCWDAGVDLFKKNADGSYTIGADTTSPGGLARVRFDAFKRDDHTGKLAHTVNGALVQGDDYTATKR